MTVRKSKRKNSEHQDSQKTTLPAEDKAILGKDEALTTKDEEVKAEAEKASPETESTSEAVPSEPSATTSDSTSATLEQKEEAPAEPEKVEEAKTEAKAEESENPEPKESAAEEAAKTDAAEEKAEEAEEPAAEAAEAAAGDKDAEESLNTSRISKQRLKSVVSADQEGEMAELEAQQSAQAKDNQDKGATAKTVAADSARAKEDLPVNDIFKSKIIVITSGKGGVGKTTSAAALSTGLALQGHKTVVIDFDVGLRNLDLIMGCERRVVYDFINVIHGEARLNQALIKDKNTDNLYILPASQTKDKESLSYHGVGLVLKELSDMGFEYVICDSPAGIETGALIALFYADVAIVTTNPEISSVRDSDRIIGILNARSRRAVNNWDPIDTRLLLTRYEPSRVEKEEMLSRQEVQGLLNVPLLGVIPESKDVLNASNTGVSIILDKKSDAGQAYSDAVQRLLGKEVPLRFVDIKKTFWSKIFG